MKRRLTTILIVFVFFIGLGLMLYPTVSDLINRAHQSYAINAYDELISKMSKEDFRKVLSDARSYNKTVTTNEFPRDEKDLAGNDDYLKAVNPSGNGMIGYLKIDSIKLRIPIYHTTTEEVLQSGIGHIPTTSLPVGGVSTHAVLTGHRGLPTAKLFTDLDKVKIGDVFLIYVLDDILAYRVDQIKTVLPTDTKDLQIVKGKDYVTLVTCTPYGINTHRLIVRGERIDYNETVETNIVETTSTVTQTPEQLVAFVVALAVMVLLLIIFIIRMDKRRKES